MDFGDEIHMPLEQATKNSQLSNQQMGVLQMKFVTLSALALLIGSGYALAGGGAPVPAIPESSPPSGRPSAVLDDTKCQAVWSLTERDGDVLAADKAAPFVTNWHMVDTDGDGKVTADEFKKGCKSGWVEEGSGSRLPIKEGSPQVPKE
jgi:hypothetical protein